MSNDPKKTSSVDIKKLADSNPQVDRRLLDEVAALRADLPPTRTGAQYTLGRSFDYSTTPKKR